ncbi:pyruvate formate lyase family protein [Zhenpiania hominis]|uniref:pyruvate formate lyase family protein n=1 Tax=Zhenpiania hominis TaxID=2763644 RepID=UPI0039F50F32
MVNAKPCGTENYDQNYGLGYQTGHDDFSPYERVNRLRSTFLETEFRVDIQRARLITEVYRKYPDLPAKLRTACALEHILKNVEIDIYEDELLEIAEFWQGKTVEDMVNAGLSEAEKAGSELGKKVYMTNLYHYGGIGHFVMDYETLLRIGYRGYLRRIEEKSRTLDQDDPNYEEKAQLYEAMTISVKAAMGYIERYGNLAEEKAEKEADQRRKAELAQIARNCRQIAGGPATTMWQELLECAYVKTGNPSKLKDRVTMSVRNGRGWGGESLTVGGVDEEGRDVTNDLTFMLLEASVHTRMMNPWLCVRMHENTPYELKVKAIECIRAGYGHPKLFNDRAAIEAMQAKDMSLAEARRYAVVGCVEPDLPGMEYGFHDAAYVNLARILELSLNSGKCVDCGKSCPRYEICAGAGQRLGPDTGSLDDFQNMEDVLESFRQQLHYWTDQMEKGLNRIDRAHRERKPLPYASLFFHNCIEDGKELGEGGARYNFTGPQASGIGTCADSLSAISQLVFDEKQCTGAQLLQALKDNWEGHEILYFRINSSHMHHYGNDDDYADRYFTEVFNAYCEAIEGRKNPRGGKFCPGVYTVNANVSLGLEMAASLDGRKRGEPLSDNMGPVHTDASSHDRNGPTAIANSVTKVNHSRATNGTLLNWKFSPECVAGYSAYFVELSEPLQMDLVKRTELSFP